MNARRAGIERCLETLIAQHDTYVFEVFEVEVSGGQTSVAPLPEPRAAVHNRLRGEDRSDDVAACLSEVAGPGAPQGAVRVLVNAAHESALL